MKHREILIMAVAAVAMCSCRTVRVVEQVPVEVHDTAYITKTMHDSTYIDRWHTIYQQADTVYIRDSISVIKYSLITDTAYRYIERPVTVSKMETVEVEKPLRWWQKGLIYIGILSLLAIITIIPPKVWTWIIRKR